MRVVIRWINEDNAASLGYPLNEEYREGWWVLETGDDEWESDLTGIPQSRMDVAQREAEAVLGSAPAFWRELPSDYGTAYVTSISR